VFNYTKLIDEECIKEKRLAHSSLVEKIALIMFNKLVPIYGCLAVEKSVESIQSIILEESLLPINRGFYCKRFIDEGLDFYNEITKDSIFVEIIENIGFYFRRTAIDDFNNLKASSTKFNFPEAIDVLKNI